MKEMCGFFPAEDKCNCQILCFLNELVWFWLGFFFGGVFLNSSRIQESLCIQDYSLNLVE